MRYFYNHWLVENDEVAFEATTDDWTEAHVRFFTLGADIAENERMLLKAQHDATLGTLLFLAINDDLPDHASEQMQATTQAQLLQLFTRLFPTASSLERSSHAAVAA